MKIAHITDLHIRRHTPGLAANSRARLRESPEMFFQCLENNMGGGSASFQGLEKVKAAGVDRIVLTGDLVDVPGCILNPTDYYMDLSPHFLPAVKKDYETLRDALDATGIPYTIIPGNHDHTPTFFSVFPTMGKTVDQGGYRFVSYCDREWANNTPHRYDRERKHMIAELADPDSPPQIHIQHFLPHPAVEGSYPFNYHDAGNITKLYAESGKVLLSLSGHYHPGTGLEEKDGVLHSAGPGFCEAPFPFRIITIDCRAGTVEDLPAAAGRLITIPALQKTFTVTVENLQVLDEPLYAGKRMAIIDRDGVINTLPSYTTGPEAMELTPGAGEAILKLKKAGFVVLVNTMQSCVGMGDVAEDTVVMNMDWLCHLLTQQAGSLDAQPDIICYSTQAGDRAITPEYAGSETVKPNTLLVDRAVELHGLKKEGAWMVGDRMSDLKLGRRFGARNILVRTGDGQRTLNDPDFQTLENCPVVENLSEAVNFILKQ